MNTDLVQWLSEQLDADERYARNAKGLLGIENAWWTWDALKSRFPELSRADAQHIERHGPARMLREIDAKRKLAEEHKPGMQKGWPNMGRHCLSCTGARVWDESSNESNCLTLRLLALPYADRPGYRNEWRP